MRRLILTMCVCGHVCAYVLWWQVLVSVVGMKLGKLDDVPGVKAAFRGALALLQLDDTLQLARAADVMATVATHVCTAVSCQ